MVSRPPAIFSKLPFTVVQLPRRFHGPGEKKGAAQEDEFSSTVVLLRKRNDDDDGHERKGKKGRGERWMKEDRTERKRERERER